MCGRTLVVLLAPDKVPDSRDEEEGEEHDGSVVHEFGGDRDVRRHTEKRDGETRPS